MGRVFKQKSGKWAIRFDVPDENGRKQKQIGGFHKKSDAEKELKKLEADILNGEYFSGSAMTVSEYLTLWLNDYVRPNLAPKTIAFYESLYRVHFATYFNHILLTDLRAVHIDSFYRYLRQSTSLSANSIHHCHKMLRAALNQAVWWDYLKITPMSKVKAPKQEKPKSSYWPPDVIPQGLALFKGEEIEWMVHIAVLTGLREGEICALNVNNIDFKHNVFHIEETAQRVTGKGIILKPPKTEDSKDVLPMTKDVAEILHKQIRHISANKKTMIAAGKPYNRQYDGYLALWQDGSLMDPSYVSRRFHKILKRQDEVKQITFHDLRHSCASWLLYNGADMKTIQLILRHSNFKVTSDTYSHISQDTKLNALSSLSFGQ